MTTPGTIEECLRLVAAPTGFLTLCAFDPQTGRSTGAHAVTADAIVEAAQWARNQDAQRHNVYWQFNPTREPLTKKPKKTDIGWLVWVHCDVDDLNALPAVLGYRVPPTLVVRSGGGFHVYWRLREPVVVNGNSAELEEANKQVLAELDPEHRGTHNLDRILRVPLTTNWPNSKKLSAGRKPEPVVVELYEPTRLYQLGDFAAEDRSAALVRNVRADLHLPADQIVARHINDPHAREQADPERAVRRAINFASGAALAGEGPKAEVLSLEQMLQVMTLIARGPIVIDKNNAARKWRLPEFEKRYAASRAEKATPKGPKLVPVTHLWIEHPQRLTADDLGFNPSEPRFYFRNGLGVYNMWESPSWPATDTALAAPFINHVAYLIPDATEREAFLDWFAAIVQQPGVRPHYHFLLVTQTQGIGRSWLADLAARLWTDYAVDVDLVRLLKDSFNSELSRKLIVSVHEAKAPSDDKYTQKERLKSLLTDSRITINEKNLPRWVEDFCARFMMFTNAVNALPISEKERRTYVAQCPATPRPADYYKQLYAALRDRTFLAAVWTLLATRDLSRYNPGTPAPVTAAKERMAEDNRTDDQQRAVDFVRAAPFEVILSSDLMEMLVPLEHHASQKERSVRVHAITRALQDIEVCTANRKIKVEGQPCRVWILRNTDSWREASAAKLKKAADETRAELKKYGSKIAVAMEAWAKAEEARVGALNTSEDF